MECRHNENHNGFTLVEIAIVMVIIGLLIGGTFGGMKLIENSRISGVVRQLSEIRSGAITFKDTYGRLPGDFRYPARLSACSTPPCSTAGNGNGRVEPPGGAMQAGYVDWFGPVNISFERAVFFHHLQASGILSLDIQNNTNLEFGQGIPKSPIPGVGYRMSQFAGPSAACSLSLNENIIIMTSTPASNINSTQGLSCRIAMEIDRKIDDGRQWEGKFYTTLNGSGANCSSGSNSCSNGWSTPDGFFSGAFYRLGY